MIEPKKIIYAGCKFIKESEKFFFMNIHIYNISLLGFKGEREKKN